MGARKFLIAYNINLRTDDESIALQSDRKEHSDEQRRLPGREGARAWSCPAVAWFKSR